MKILLVLNERVAGLNNFHISRVNQKNIPLDWGDVYNSFEKQVIYVDFVGAFWLSKKCNLRRFKKFLIGVNINEN